MKRGSICFSGFILARKVFMVVSMCAGRALAFLASLR
jgi:hypothetical protein